MADLQIEYRRTESLIPYARNARTHSDAQVAQIAASIREFGFNNPVLVDSRYGIIAGHGRVLAARKLDMDEVPVIELSHLTDSQRRAYILADNRLAQNAGWDEELLRLELADLKLLDLDLELLGFANDEIDRLLDGGDDDKQGLTDDDAVPEVAEDTVTQPGDIWLLGNHRVLCGDATNAEDYARLLGGELADMAFTDPPYNVNYANSAKDKLRGKNRPILNDNLGDDFQGFLTAACTHLLAVTKGAAYIAMSSSELDTLQSAFRAAGGKWSTFIIWAKNTFTLGRADYQRQYEPILYGWKDGTDHFWCGARDQGDVWQIKKPAKNDLHPTMKPVELVERAVRNSSKTRDVVLDPFGGSGSTLIACEKSVRAARLIELDPKYVDVIVRRWQAFTGQTASREADGVMFNSLVNAAAQT
ncbi:MAG: site-specific DNA-methyltransferase [Castellaniella sp.]|uniref:site-specific DNA-methyltransferase n=1 Tax=Castellaniella sp. TaxID=1955812 RepID=UPI003A892CA2